MKLSTQGHEEWLERKQAARDDRSLKLVQIVVSEELRDRLEAMLEANREAVSGFDELIDRLLVSCVSGGICEFCGGRQAP